MGERAVQVVACGHAQVENEQCDGDGEHAVAECLRTVRVEHLIIVEGDPLTAGHSAEVMNGSRVPMIWSGNGVSGEELERSSSQA
jgi:hypothetical protein